MSVGILFLVCILHSTTGHALRRPAPAREKESDGELAGGFRWPYLKEGEPPDVFVMIARNATTRQRRKLFEWIFHPMSFTLGEAFSRMGSSVGFYRAEEGEQLVEEVSASVRGGKRPLLVTVSHIVKASNRTKEVLRRCGKEGAFLVLHQAEILRSRPMVEVLQLIRLVQDLEISEVWDISRVNMMVMRGYGLPKTVKTRYFPPGYTPLLDLGVDVKDPSRDESRLAFLGNWWGRPEGIRERYNTTLGDQLVVLEAMGATISSADALKKFVTRWPVQINVHHHQQCCPSMDVMEHFRMSQLLSNKACVISARAFGDEEEDYQDIIRFVDVNETLDAWRNISKDVEGCRLNAYNRYKTQFAAQRLLNKSGFLKQWKLLRKEQ